MKKTQSLKLMLLGLMASASMGAWAGVGDIFYDPSSKLFFEETAGEHATVIGVTSTNGKITIPDYCYNAFDNPNGDRKLYINDVANDWFAKTTVETKHYDATQDKVVKQNEQAFSLLNYNGDIELTIDASQLKKMRAAALIPLNNKIVKFVVTDNCKAFEEIEDYSFSNPSWSATPVNQSKVDEWVKNQRKAINDAKDAYEAAFFAINDQPAIVNGKYNGKLDYADFNGADVYKLLLWPGSLGACGDEVYVVMGDEFGARDFYNVRNRYLYQIDLEHGGLMLLGQKSLGVYAGARPRVDNAGQPTGELVQCGADGTINVVAVLLKADNKGASINDELTSTPANAVLGLNNLKTYYANLYQKLVERKAEFDNVLANYSTMAEPTTPWGKAAWTTLRALKDAKDKQTAADDAYEQAYGTQEIGHWTETSPYAVWQGYESNSAVADAVKKGNISSTTTWESHKTVEYYDAALPGDRPLYEEEFNQVKVIMNTMAAAGYLKLNAGGNNGYERPSFTKIRDNKLVADKQVAMLEERVADLIAFNDAPYNKPAFEDDGTTPIMKFTDTDNTYPYDFPYTTEQQTGLTYAQLCAAIPQIRDIADEISDELTEAKQDYANNKDYYDSFDGVDDLDLAAMAALDPDTHDAAVYVPGVNKKLKSVDIDVAAADAPAFATIGVSAFQGCEEAVFDGTNKLPEAIKTVKTNAFYGAAKFAPDFTDLVNLETIGDEAFANTAATDGDFHRATKLATVGKNIFLNCAIENLLLAGTPLKEIPEGLAQCLKHTNEYPFMDACGHFYNFDNKDNKLTDHVLNAFEAEMLAPYLLKKEYTAADVAALVGTKLSQQQVDIITAKGLVKGEMKVNTSLTVASLPEAITKIQQVAGYAGVDGFVGTFERCIKLADLTGGIPVGVTEIGKKAFYGTKIQSFDLSKLDKLNYIGTGAFAGNSELTTVTLPEAAAYNETGLTELPAGVFECDGDLETVIINPEMQCLPEGLFADSKIETLDLSNTQVTVIPNLFKATENKPNTTLKYVILPDTKYKEDNYTMEIPGIRVIGDNAFAHMHALIGSDKTITTAAGNKFIVPASVELMGTAVFQDDQILEEVEFTKYSKLTKLGVNTFNSTPKLKKVTFLTANCIDKDFEQINLLGTVTIEDLTGCADLERIIDFSKTFGFGDTQIFASTGRKDRPVVIVTAESKAALVTDYYGQGYQQGYTILNAELPTIAVKGSYPDDNGNPMWATTYFNENFGTWVPVEKDKQNGANVTVWTAYQDYDVIYAYPAKHNNKYYKIPAAGYLKKHDLVNDKLVSNASGARFLQDPQPLGGDINWDQIKEAIKDKDVAELLALLSVEQKEELLDEFTAEEIAKMIENLEESDLEDLFEALLESEASYADVVEAILAEILPTTKFSMFAAQTRKGTYICGPTVKYNPGSAAVIITSDKDQPVNVELYSTKDFKYQSTLDWKNELKVSGKPLSTTTDNDVYKFSADTDGWGFFKQVAEIPQGKVIFPMSGYQGTAYPDFKDPKSISVPMPSRVDIVFLSGEFTSIDDVKQYVKAMKESGDIYNMRGMKVTAPVKGQMYIQNGKKFIQK